MLKKYPDTVKIDLIKTDFIAITTHDNENFFIGSNGKLIVYDNSKKIYLLFLEMLILKNLLILKK